MSDPARLRRVPRPGLMLVTDRARLRGRSLSDVVAKAVAGGVNMVQIRDAGASSSDLAEMAKRTREFIEGRALVFVNGDIEAALAAEADGVHLPEASPQALTVRSRVGGAVLISRAVHSVEAAQRADDYDAHLLIAGTIFETASKHGAAPIGVEGLWDIVEATSLPVLAIGGVTATNAGQVVASGAAGVAVIGALLDPPDTREAAVRLIRALSAPAGV